MLAALTVCHAQVVDIGVESIVWPKGSVEAWYSWHPSACWRNFGTVDAGFRAWLAIYDTLGVLAYIDSTFVDQVQVGDIMVGGTNFGCGSSREHAPLALKGSGISCVIAESFARIFYRNAINIGLPILECPEAVASTEAGQVLEVDLSSGTIKNLDTGQVFQAGAYPPFLMSIIEAGGLIPYTQQKLGIRPA